MQRIVARRRQHSGERDGEPGQPHLLAAAEVRGPWARLRTSALPHCLSQTHLLGHIHVGEAQGSCWMRLSGWRRAAPAVDLLESRMLELLRVQTCRVAFILLPLRQSMELVI